MSIQRVGLVVLATLVIFAAGVVTGGLLVRQTVRFPQPQPVGPPPLFPRRFDALRAATDQLGDLSPDQRQRVERIIRDGQEKLSDFFLLFEPDIQDVFRKMREDIKAELTPDQRRRMEEIMRRRLRPMDGRGPGFRPGPGPGPGPGPRPGPGGPPPQ